MHVAANAPACDSSIHNGNHFQAKNGVQRLCYEIKITLRQPMIKMWSVQFNDAVNKKKCYPAWVEVEWYMCAERAMAEWRCGKIRSTMDEENINPCPKVHHISHVAWTGNRKDGDQIYCVTFTSNYVCHKWKDAYIKSTSFLIELYFILARRRVHIFRLIYEIKKKGGKCSVKRKRDWGFFFTYYLIVI